MTSLHNEIMNIRCDESNISIHASVSLAYKEGHRDARHAAAELAINSDAEIKRLRDFLHRVAIDINDECYNDALSTISEAVNT
jgi:hypothetical protein